MKNPFLNTDEYSIKKQHQRLMKRKEKQSKQSSWSSANSFVSTAYGSQVSNPYFTYSKQLLHTEPSHEYFPSDYGWRSYRFEIEEKRCKFFGLDDLRYQPKYLEYIHASEESQPKRIQKISRQNSARSSKMSKGSGSSKQNYFHPPIDEVDESNASRSKSLSQDQSMRKQSILQDMINLQNVPKNNSTSMGNNDFYSSIADLKSLRSRKDSGFSGVSNTNSIQFQEIIPKKNRFSVKENKLRDRRRSQYCNDSIRSRNSVYAYEAIDKIKQNFDESHINNLQPKEIHVRGQVFFLYHKNKK